MLKYLHSFYFNQGEILWICFKGERIKRADISGINNAGACNWNLNENPKDSDRFGFHSNVWMAEASNQPQNIPKGQELQLFGVRGCWFYLYFLGLNIFRI